MDFDASILDVSTELISETPVKSKPIPLSLRSVSQDVIKCLGIVTVKEGRVDAATLNSLNELIAILRVHTVLYFHVFLQQCKTMGVCSASHM